MPQKQAKDWESFEWTEDAADSSAFALGRLQPNI